MTKHQLKAKRLPNYGMKSVFGELYLIEDMIKSGKYMEQINYITIRLVTIIEQFFRKVIEFLLRRHPEKRPQSVTLDTRLINNIIRADFNQKRRHAMDVIISHTFSFQNTKDIADAMNTYGKIQIFSGDSKQFSHNSKTGLIRRDYNTLFEARHDVVHSIVRQPHLNVKRYYDMTEKLLNHTLEKVEYYGFHHEHDQALLELRSDKADVYYRIAKKLYDNILDEDRTANNLFKHGKYKEAIGHYDRVLYLEPDDFSSHYGKVCSLHLLERHHEAIDCCDMYLKLDNDRGVCFYMGLSLQQLGEHDAIRCFMEAVEHESDKTRTYIKWAISRENLRLFDDILAYVIAVLEIDPKNSAALDIKETIQEEISRLSSSPPDAT